MGGFINSQSDAEICEVLNKRFSNDVNVNDPQQRTYLNELRDFFQNQEDLFEPHHHLHRTFHRLAVSVTGGTSVPTSPLSRKRWLFLLHGNLPAAVDVAIRHQLTAILKKGTAASAVNYVTFSTVHIPTASGDQFELYDNNNRNSSIPTLLVDGSNTSYCALILLCNVDLQLALNPTEPDPPKADNNEKNIPFFGAKPVKRLPKKPPPKKSAKKSVKKSSKKAAKKTAKKTGKGK
jgi:hypothetical protein